MHRRAERTRRLLVASVQLASVLGIVRLATALEIGDKAPDFTLPSTTGEAISLSQFRGKKHVLLEFYVNDFGATWGTGACGEMTVARVPEPPVPLACDAVYGLQWLR